MCVGWLCCFFVVARGSDGKWRDEWGGHRKRKVACFRSAPARSCVCERVVREGEVARWEKACSRGGDNEARKTIEAGGGQTAEKRWAKHRARRRQRRPSRYRPWSRPPRNHASSSLGIARRWTPCACLCAARTAAGTWCVQCCFLPRVPTRFVFGDVSHSSLRHPPLSGLPLPG